MMAMGTLARISTTNLRTSTNCSGRSASVQQPPGADVPSAVEKIPVALRRSKAPMLPEVSELDAVRHQQLWIPPGFAHGFLVLSDRADFLYKTTDYWYPEHERSLLWNDPDLAIPWPAGLEPQLAAKDAAAKRLAEAEVFD